MLLTDKKEQLDKLYYNRGKQRYDFFLFYLQKDEKQDTFSSKWHTYAELFLQHYTIALDKFKENPKEFFFNVNNRSILPCEVVLDMENREHIEEIIAKLKQDNLFFYCYDTGSRGYHIHLFFKTAMTVKEKENFIKEYGLGHAEMEKANVKVGIALENCEHWKTGIKKTLVISNYKEIPDEEGNIFIEDINYLPFDYNAQQDNLPFSDAEITEIHKEAVKFRDEMIKKLRIKGTLTDFEKQALKDFMIKNGVVN